MLFRLSSAAVAVIILGIVVGATVVGIAIGRKLADRHESWREPAGVTQAALLGFVGLLLAFGLTMAVGRYEARRITTVDEANAIGTAYLRAQTLREPIRSQSLTLLTQYTDARLVFTRSVADTPRFRQADAEAGRIQGELWSLAGQALDADPVASAPRLYVESLNELINMDATRVSELRNRIPTSVVYLQIFGSAVALALLGMYLAMLGRTVATALIAAITVAVILLVILDLDRPVRGFITVPDAALVTLRVSMDSPPPAAAPRPR